MAAGGAQLCPWGGGRLSSATSDICSPESGGQGRVLVLTRAAWPPL